MPLSVRPNAVRCRISRGPQLWFKIVLYMANQNLDYASVSERRRYLAVCDVSDFVLMYREKTWARKPSQVSVSASNPKRNAWVYLRTSFTVKNVGRECWPEGAFWSNLAIFEKRLDTPDLTSKPDVAQHKKLCVLYWDLTAMWQVGVKEVLNTTLLILSWGKFLWPMNVRQSENLVRMQKLTAPVLTDLC